MEGTPIKNPYKRQRLAPSTGTSPRGGTIVSAASINPYRRKNNQLSSTTTKSKDISNDGTKKLKDSSDRHPSLISISPEILGSKLLTKPTYLTEDKKSWFVLCRKWIPTPSQQEFKNEWNLHPSTRHQLKVFGRVVSEKRWSQAWGFSYQYSGAMAIARPIHESTILPELLTKCNELVDAVDSKPYNGCLQNWYTPEDTIARHSDDEKSLRGEFPIFSLSWGGTRRFVFRSRKDTNEKVEIFLNDGDLLVMGGTCQKTHYHEVPKLRKTMDPITGNRINWTLRAFSEFK